MALSAGATKSMVLINPVTNNAKIIGDDISFDSGSALTAIRFDLYKVTTLGSPAGTSATLDVMDDTDPVAATCTALTALSAEPTTVAAIHSGFIQPIGGGVPQPLLPNGREYKLKGGGSRWGIRLITPSGVSPNCCLNIQIEEGGN